MSTTLMQGHAAWIWIDLTGRGPRWNLAIPIEREDWEEVDEDDDETCRFVALFPVHDHRCEIKELVGLPERPIIYPRTAPTDAEIADAKMRAKEAE
jgi:hypothetical protein